MSGDSELMILRLGLIAVVFAFVLVVALTMRQGVAIRSPRDNRSRRRDLPGPRLVLENPGRTGLPAGATWELAGVMTIGRDPANGIMLPDASVSGRHASIERVAAGWRLADLGSTNGTFVNGRPVDARGTLLTGGERLTFGTLVLQLQS